MGVLLAPVPAFVALHLLVHDEARRPRDRGAPLRAPHHRRRHACSGPGWRSSREWRRRRPWSWAAIPLATALASAFFSLAFSGGSKTCQLCKLPAPEQAGFSCPRCHDRVCARPTCWNAKYVRCVRCHEREIVILPTAESWWRPRLGPKVKNGQCNHCYKEAHEADLRECGQCHWPMCQRCWDYHNGICQRCKWVIPDLPPAHRGVRGRRGRRRLTSATRARTAPPRQGGPARVSNPPPVAQPGAPSRRPDPRAGPRRP